MILDDLKKKQIQYLKEKAPFEVGVIRFLFSTLKNREIELKPEGKELSDEDVQKVFKKQIKMRREAIEGYEKTGNSEAKLTEEREMNFLESLLNEYYPSEAN